MAPITYEDFLRVDMRVGRVVRAEPHPRARKPSIRLWIDFGPELGVRTSSAALAARYRPEERVCPRFVGHGRWVGQASSL
jgi:tRNA-binding protein